MAEEIGLPELSFKQIVTVCELAEVAARRYILSKVPKREISDLDISIDINASKLLTMNVDVDLTLSPLAQEVDVDHLVAEAVNTAIKAAESKLREMAACKLKG